MLKPLIIFFTITFISLNLWSQVALTPPPKTVEEVCAYDAQWCNQLLIPNRSEIKKPDQKIMLMLTELKEPLKQIAEKYDVDPRALFGSILTENTLNVRMDDDVQNWLVKLKLAPKGEIFGRAFTVGLGQINPGIALEVEPIVAKIENRPPKTIDEIAQELLTAGGAMSYASAILKNAQDKYLAAGFDIKDRPDLLATLYNLGSPAQRAKNAKKAGASPKPNYFGFFVQTYLSDIEKAIDWKQPTKHNENKKNKIEPVVLITKLSKALMLSIRPPQCIFNYDQKSEKTTAPSISASGEYIVVSRDLDCDLNEWILIQTHDGAVGWTSKIKLQEASVKTVTTPQVCKVSTKCQSEIEKIPDISPLGYNSAGLLEVKMVYRFLKDKKINWRLYNGGCNNFYDADSRMKQSIEMFQKECGSLAEGATQQKYQEVLALMNDLLKNAPTQPISNIIDGSSFTVCRAFKYIKAKRAASPNTQTEACDCTTFMKTNPLGYREYEALDLLETQLKTDAALNQFALTNLDGFKTLLGRIKSDARDALKMCNYDRKKTIPLVEKLLNSSCVKRVFYPYDEAVHNGLSKYKDRLHWSTFAEDDRFAVQLDDGCQLKGITE